MALDPLKTALAGLGTAFAAGVAWMTLKARVTAVEKSAAADVARLRDDVNNMGRHRVKKVEDGIVALGGRMDEHREHADTRHEKLMEREALLRERVARMESAIDSLRAEIARGL